MGGRKSEKLGKGRKWGLKGLHISWGHFSSWVSISLVFSRSVVVVVVVLVATFTGAAFFFLAAYTGLYKSLCRSALRLVHLSVTLLKFSLKSYLNRITAPAHPYATDALTLSCILVWYFLNNLLKLPFLFLLLFLNLLLLPLYSVVVGHTQTWLNWFSPTLLVCNKTLCCFSPTL